MEMRSKAAVNCRLVGLSFKEISRSEQVLAEDTGINYFSRCNKLFMQKILMKTVRQLYRKHVKILAQHKYSPKCCMKAKQYLCSIRSLRRVVQHCVLRCIKYFN